MPESIYTAAYYKAFPLGIFISYVQIKTIHKSITLRGPVPTLTHTEQLKPEQVEDVEDTDSTDASLNLCDQQVPQHGGCSRHNHNPLSAQLLSLITTMIHTRDYSAQN